MLKEIGSEFQSMPYCNGSGLVFPRQGSLVFSGRTAIEMVLNKLSNIKTALLPSYCCESMIIPFKARGINISFFDVNWVDGLTTNINQQADILLWCNYFGYFNEIPEFNGVIIEDITHSLFSEIQCHQKSDYLIASIRKWEPVLCGGYCSINVASKEPPKEYIDLKALAMKLKSEYLIDLDQNKKLKYLSLFKECNHWLADHYSGLSIDSFSKEYLSCFDFNDHRRIRIRNAHVLYKGLKGKVKFLFSEESMDCPLFVPILLDNRKKVFKALIENDIYCPIHWPRPEECNSNIYDKELSLVCDHRYSEHDMERIVDIILNTL